ncbi:MAG: fibronectin type III domain-containing protein, partial [Gammaproteobacteria bacterium]|nr:fibronectin type III domain-containing protein [Gammaproteobacteria bacterium]
RDSRTDREVSFNTHSSLPAGSRYEVRMALRNEFGTGPWSKSRFVTTPAGSNAAAPPNFRNPGSVYATSHGGPNIDMHWNPPPGIDATSRVGRYEVQWKLDAATTFASTDKTTLQADGRNTVDGRNAYVIRDLGTAEARYQVQVRACNATGCNSWTNARRNDNTDRIGINYGLGNSDNIDSIDEMIVPYVEALQIGDRSMTVNWRPPLHADGTAIDYGFPITTYRARWRHAIGGTAERKAWLNPSGAAGEPVVNPDPTTNARRSYTISGLQNNTDYQVEFWSERQREDETGVTKVDGYVNAGGKGWTSWVAKLAAGTSPAAVTSVFIPRVVLLGAPQGPQPNSVPALNALTLGDQPGSINASWSAPTNSVSAYQVRWRPYVAGDGKQNWQVADVTGTAHTIAAYTRAGGGANTALREISYEVQVRSRNARGNNAWSAWSSSQRITPPVPELLGLRVFAAENADSNAQTETASVPAFSADVFAYAVEVAEDAGVVWLTPRAADGHTITIGKVGARTPPAVASGARSAAISLAPGATERVEVRVSSTRGGKTETVSYVYALTRPGAPLGPPSGFSVLAGAFDLELAWAGPSGGGEVREFRVRWRTAGVDASGNTPATEPGAWQPSAEGVSTRLAKRRVIGNLQPGTAYQAQVRAVDTAGELGQWSAPLTETPRSFTFDVDGSGASDTTDSIIVGRYLIGVRGSALTAGQTLPDGADLEEITGKLSV